MHSFSTKLKSLSSEDSFGAALVSSMPAIIYLTNFNYFSIEEREAYLLITQKNNFIITDGRYAQAVKEQIKDFQLVERKPEYTLQNILTDIAKREKIKSLGVELNDLTFVEYTMISKTVEQIKPLDLSRLRIIKSSEEINLIAKACEIGDSAFEYIIKQIRPGISETELAVALEFFIRRQSADISFRPIVAFGNNAAVPHHKSGEDKLKHNHSILLDFGVKYKNYCSDMTRTIFFGNASGEEKNVYKTVLCAQQKAVDHIKQILDEHSPAYRQLKKTPTQQMTTHYSISAKNIDRIARDFILSQGFLSIPHSLGHGIGLEVHEPPHISPNSQDRLQPGMVFSIEPGIYLPGKFGVRIEDLFVLEETGLRQLTKAPKDFPEL